MAADERHAHLLALQPLQKPEKIGKRIYKEETLKSTDVITHEGFDRVFERKYEVEFPDYFTP